nr:ribonuclease H-like domain-containing protein [Tanacetum cinerariifolium]
MVTRFRVETNRPTERINLHVSSVSPLPKSYHDAFSGPNWQNAMHDEYHALIKNKTWTLVPRPPDTNIVSCMWLFHHKYLADGTLSRYKARLVANGSTQLEGIDVDETFSPVVKPGLFLSQKKYVVEILDRVHMVNCNPNRTPIDTESKLGSDGDPVSDPTLYRSLPTLSRSSAKALYRDVTNVVAETCWLRNLLRELHTPLSSATLVYCDNVRVLRVPSRYQYADIFTKGLPSALFEEFRSSLSVRCSPAPTAGKC